MGQKVNPIGFRVGIIKGWESNWYENKSYAVKLVEEIKNDKQFIIHNFKIIRDELRKAPKILPLYDGLVSKNVITINNHIEKLANEYFKEYQKQGGIQKKNMNFMNDLRIVACASIKGFNLVFSDDEKSMHKSLAKETYESVNLKYNYRTPTFYHYNDLKKKYLNK